MAEIVKTIPPRQIPSHTADDSWRSRRRAIRAAILQVRIQHAAHPIQPSTALRSFRLTLLRSPATGRQAPVRCSRRLELGGAHLAHAGRSDLECLHEGVQGRSWQRRAPSKDCAARNGSPARSCLDGHRAQRRRVH
eukprot:scaffold480_cov257-Pinguiococcus_pyrenoidosus.AAC.8